MNKNILLYLLYICEFFPNLSYKYPKFLLAICYFIFLFLVFFLFFSLLLIVTIKT